MMNQREFAQSCREYEGKFDTGYRAVEGAVRPSGKEEWKHGLAKYIIVKLMKENVPIIDIPHIMGLFIKDIIGNKELYCSKSNPIIFKNPLSAASEWLNTTELQKTSYPKWYSPRVFTEVRIGKNVFDIVALTLDGAYVCEIADSEDGKSLKRKERNAVNLGFKFVEVRC